MTNNDNKVSLVNIGGGAAVEKFDQELKRAIDNILDPNTIPDVKRVITLKLEIKPDKNRDFGPATIHCDSKLAPAKPHATNLYFGKNDDGEGVAAEHNMRQMQLQFNQHTGDDNVTPLESRRQES